MQAMNRDEHAPFINAGNSELLVTKFYISQVASTTATAADNPAAGRIAALLQTTVTSSRLAEWGADTQVGVHIIWLRKIRGGLPLFVRGDSLIYSGLGVALWHSGASPVLGSRSWH